jgi:hypothetical protein
MAGILFLDTLDIVDLPYVTNIEEHGTMQIAKELNYPYGYIPDQPLVATVQ